MLWGAPGRSMMTRRGRDGQGSGRGAAGGGAAFHAARSASSCDGRVVVGGVERAHVVQRDRVDRPLQPVDRLAVGMVVAEQDPIGRDVHHRLGLITALDDARSSIVVNALPVRWLQPRADQDVGGDRHRRLEGLARRLYRQLRTVAPAAQPEIRAQLLQLRGDAQRIARACAFVQHLGRDRRQAGPPRRIAGGAAAEHERRRHDRGDVALQGDDLESAAQREARCARQGDRRQWADRGRLRHRRRRLGHAVTGASDAAAGWGVMRRSRWRVAATRAKASRTDAIVVCW